MSLMSTCQGMDHQLTLIRRTQEKHQRMMLNVEFKLNQALSKLISFTHIKRLDFMEEISGNLSKALERWETKGNEIWQRANKVQQKFQWNDEQARSLEEMHSMLAVLVASNQSTRESNKHKKDDVLGMSKEQLSEVEETNKSNFNEQSKVEYVLPAKADCYELDKLQRVDGVYKFLEPELNERHRDFNERYCAFATDGAAWTVIQQRNEGSNLQAENFNRSWDEYRAGFGSLKGNFWFGNEFIHRIVYRDDYVLRIELEDQNGLPVWAEYELFRLDSESYNYQLVIGKLNGNSTTSDALTYHNRMDFRAYDRNEDCAGWWFDRCQEAQSNLNGQRIIWGNWHNEYSVKASRMLIRPRNLNSLDTHDIYDEDSPYNF
ncbi:angiopoietin-related protein 7 [Drosophila montana]|uniref:angiopoietin-related protein 7 n=1 Tax=Drosophila montana TaxID=40370 RepID=UPI00313B3D77